MEATIEGLGLFSTLWAPCGYIGIMEKEMEATIEGLGLFSALWAPCGYIGIM